MEEAEGSPAAEGARREEARGTHMASTIDIDRLTDRVYRLMQAELKQDRARREGASPLGKR